MQCSLCSFWDCLHAHTHANTRTHYPGSWRRIRTSFCRMRFPVHGAGAKKGVGVSSTEESWGGIIVRGKKERRCTDKQRDRKILLTEGQQGGREEKSEDRNIYCERRLGISEARRSWPRGGWGDSVIDFPTLYLRLVFSLPLLSLLLSGSTMMTIQSPEPLGPV